MSTQQDRTASYSEHSEIENIHFERGEREKENNWGDMFRQQHMHGPSSALAQLVNIEFYLTNVVLGLDNRTIFPHLYWTPS